MVQGLSDFFKTALRQKPYFRQVRHTSHCDGTARLGSSSPSSAAIEPRCILFSQRDYVDVEKITELISELRLPGIGL